MKTFEICLPLHTKITPEFPKRIERAEEINSRDHVLAFSFRYAYGSPILVRPEPVELRKS